MTEQQSAAPRTIDYGRYELRHPWPENCKVQGGSHGLVLVRAGGSYQTAFVEAFPRNPDTFIRGEGEDMATAEDAAWAKFTRYSECDHTCGFETRGYRNGCGFCKRCGLFAVDVFDLAEIGSVCCTCGVGTYWTQVDGQLYCREHAPSGRHDDHPLAALLQTIDEPNDDGKDPK